MTLRQSNTASDAYEEWVELDLEPEMDDAVFAWNETDRLAVRYQ